MPCGKAGELWASSILRWASAPPDGGAVGTLAVKVNGGAEYTVLPGRLVNVVVG